jgi:hypothetical protein
MSDHPNISNDTIVEFQIAYERVSASIGRDTAIRRNLIKQARENGVDTEMAVLAVKTKKKYSAQEASQRLANLLRSLALVHMPIEQGDLFRWPAEVSANTQHAAQSWQAEEDGYAAGKAGADPDSNPYHRGSEEHVLWGRSYDRGAADHTVQSGGTERVPAARTRRRRGSNGAAEQTAAAE